MPDSWGGSGKDDASKRKARQEEQNRKGKPNPRHARDAGKHRGAKGGGEGTGKGKHGRK
jgi:hypothetical protein